MPQVLYDDISDDAAPAPAVLAVPAVVRRVGFVSFTSVCHYPPIEGFSFPVYGSSG